MKKILLLILIVCFGKFSFSQSLARFFTIKSPIDYWNPNLYYSPNGTTYPVTQSLGSTNTMVVSKGGLTATQTFVLPAYEDTTAANGNNLYTSGYTASTIWSNSDSSIYVLNKTSFGTYWFKIGGAGGGPTGSFWNLTGNYLTTIPAGYGLGTNSVDNLPIITSGITRLLIPDAGIGNSTASDDSVLVTKNDGYTLAKTAKSAFTPTWQQTLAATNGNKLTQYNPIDIDGNDLDFGDFNQIWYWSRPNTKQTDIYQIMNGDIITSTIRNLARTKSAEVTIDSTGDYGIGVLIQSATNINSSVLEVGEAKVTLKLNNNPFYITRPGVDTPFTVSTTGNVGINAGITPSEKLHVVGNIRMETGDVGVGKVLQDDGTGAGVAKWTTPSTVATSVPISGLTAATGTNTIDNGDYNQIWKWDALTNGSGLYLTSLSTASTGGTQKLLRLNSTGTNSGASFGIYVENGHTSSAANTAGYFSATNGSANYAIIVPSGGGSVGIGTSTPAALQHNVSTTEQLRIGYDGSNYYSTTVGSTGGVTFNAVGSGQGFTFSDPITNTNAVLTTPNLGTPSAATLTNATGLPLTTGLTGGNWKTIYTNGSGVVTELALGASGKVLTSNGASSAPTWETPSGGATTALDNLASVAINTSLLPGTDNAIDWGSTTKGFRKGYFSSGAAMDFGNGQQVLTHNGSGRLTITTAAGIDDSLILYTTGSKRAVMLIQAVDYAAELKVAGSFGASISLGSYSGSNSMIFTGASVLYNSNNSIAYNTTNIKFNNGSFDVDFQVKGDGDDNMIYGDASQDAVGMGIATPAASAKLDITSTTKGFLPPRMTGTQAEAISTPAEGLMVYSTDGSGSVITSKGWWGYDGSTWVKLN